MKKILLSLFVLAPLFSFAASTPKDFADIVDIGMSIINKIIPVIIAIAVLWIVYTAFLLIKDEGEKRDEHKNTLIWGIVSLFIMISIWGIVNVIVKTFNLDDQGIYIPQINISGGNGGNGAVIDSNSGYNTPVSD